MTDLFPDESILNIETEEEYPNRHMCFDGAVNVHGNGIKAILISPAGAHFPMAIKLRFPCTNNIVKYEAYLQSRSRLNMNVKDLKVYGDSILIIS